MENTTSLTSLCIAPQTSIPCPPLPGQGAWQWHTTVRDVDISPVTLLTFTYTVLRTVYNLSSRTRLKWRVKPRPKIAEYDNELKEELIEKSRTDGEEDVYCQCGKLKEQILKWKSKCQAPAAIFEPIPLPEPPLPEPEETVDPKDAWKPINFEVELAKYVSQVAKAKKGKADELLLDLSKGHENIVRDCDLPCCLKRILGADNMGEIERGVRTQAFRDSDGIDLEDTESRVTNALRNRPSRARRSQERAIRCEEEGCGKVFRRIYQYNHHLRCHRKPHSCPHCGLGFSLAKDLGRHVNTIHEAETVYYCKSPGCKYGKNSREGKFFKRKDHWRRHMRSQHQSLDELEEEEEDVEEEEREE